MWQHIDFNDWRSRYPCVCHTRKQEVVSNQGKIALNLQMKKITLVSKMKDNFLNTLNFREKNENVDKHCNVKLVLSGD